MVVQAQKQTAMAMVVVVLWVIMGSVAFWRGGLSRSISWVMIYPVDFIKTHIQAAPLDTPRSERTIWSVGQRLVRQHGWRYMFRGLGVTVVRAFPVNGTIFPVYELNLSQITKF